MEKKQHGAFTSNRFAVLTGNDADPVDTLLRANELSQKGNQTKHKKNNEQVAAKTEQMQSQKPEGHRPQQNGRGGGRGGRGSRAHREGEPPGIHGSDGTTSNDNKNGNMKISAESRIEHGGAQPDSDYGMRGIRGKGRVGRGRGKGRTGPTAGRAAGEKGEGVSGKQQPELDCPNGTSKTIEHGGAQPDSDYGMRGIRGKGRVGRGRGKGRAGPTAGRAAGEKGEGVSGKQQPELDCPNGTSKTGEGVDSSQWKKGVAYQKKQATDKEEEVEEHLVESHHGQRKNVAAGMKVNKNNGCEVQRPWFEDKNSCYSLFTLSFSNVLKLSVYLTVLAFWSLIMLDLL